MKSSQKFEKTFLVDLISLIWVKEAFSQYLNFKSVCTTCPILHQHTIRTIAYYNIQGKVVENFYWAMYLVSRSELLLWICSNQYLTFFSRTCYSLTINFQLVFFPGSIFYAALFTIRETLNIHNWAQNFRKSQLNSYNPTISTKHS